jgi:uncharacterized protein (TIGR02147 family)
MNVANFQVSTIELAKQALDRHPWTCRDVSTLTLTLSEKTFMLAREKIEGLRKELLLLAEQDQNVNRVYQANFQLFPLTK